MRERIEIHSPLEQFQLTNLIDLRVPYMEIDISSTNMTLPLITIIGIIWIVIKIVTYKGGFLVPTNWQGIIEIYINEIWKLTKLSLEKSDSNKNIKAAETGEKNGIEIHNEMQLADKQYQITKKFMPFLLTIMTFILLANLLGMVPYIYSVTASLGTALGLSFSIWLGITILAFKLHGWNYISILMPAGAPMALAPLLVAIELISYTARAISLGLRLCANITAGHLLISIISGFVIKIAQIGGILSLGSLIPLLLVFILMFLEVAVAIIQAYVFTLLTAIYLHDAIYLH